MIIIKNQHKILSNLINFFIQDLFSFNGPMSIIIMSMVFMTHLIRRVSLCSWLLIWWAPFSYNIFFLGRKFPIANILLCWCSEACTQVKENQLDNCHFNSMRSKLVFRPNRFCLLFSFDYFSSAINAKQI